MRTPLPRLADDPGFVIATQELETIETSLAVLRAEADLKASQARELKTNIVTIEDLDEVEVLETAAARATTRAELLIPSLERAKEEREHQRQLASKVIIAAAEAERDLIMVEAFAAIDALTALSHEHRALEGTTRNELMEKYDRGRWRGLSYGPPVALTAQLTEWARNVRNPIQR